MKTPRIDDLNLDAVNDRFASLRTELSTEHARAMGLRGRGWYVAASRCTLALQPLPKKERFTHLAAATAVEDTMARPAAIGCASMAVASLPKVR